MLLNILTTIHNTMTLLFGVYTSAAFLGIRMNRRNIFTLFVFSLLTGGVYILSYMTHGAAYTEKVFPLIVHIPMILLFSLYYKYNTAISTLSVLTAYLCCQISNWFGIAAQTLTHREWVYYSVRIVVTITFFIILLTCVSDITAPLLQKPFKSLVILAVLPFVYYIFDYVTTVYTHLLYSGLEIVEEFFGFVLCISYLLFLFLYFKEYELSQEARQRTQIMKMKRIQSEKELDAIRRSAQAVSIQRHDMRHFLLTISTYIEDNENEKALTYINEVIHRADRTALEKYCKNDIINLILSSHKDRMERSQIHFDYSIQIPESLSYSDVDMTAILSNAIENAIQAVEKLPEAKRIIKLDIKMNDNKLLICLKNTYADKPELVGGLPYTPESKHGFGTQSIWYVTEKLGGSCQFRVSDQWFILQIIL